MTTRTDLFLPIHKGLRRLLFDLGGRLARADFADAKEVRQVLDQMEATLAFLKEHAHLEDTHVLVELRRVAPRVAAEIAAEHAHLESLERSLTREAGILALSAGREREMAGARLLGLWNRFVAAHLAHMDREETEANEALWAHLSEEELLGVRGRTAAALGPERLAAWAEVVLPALNPKERAALAAHQ